MKKTKGNPVIAFRLPRQEIEQLNMIEKDRGSPSEKAKRFLRRKLSERIRASEN